MEPNFLGGPLEALHAAYLDLTAQIHARTISLDEALLQLQAREVVDAAGNTWRIDPVTQSFVRRAPGGDTSWKLADPAEFAYQAPPGMAGPGQRQYSPNVTMPDGIPNGPPNLPMVPDPAALVPLRRGDQPGPGRRLRPLLIAGVAAIVVIGLVVAAVVLWPGGGSEGSREGRAAGRLFAADPAARTDGRDQELNQVAAAGATVVAVGGEDDNLGYRAQFLVSKDAGRSFQLATVRTPGGDVPPVDEVPRLIAGSASGWVALGDHLGGTVVWTSLDGRTWTRQPDTVGAVFGARDRVSAVAWTGAGFTAVGATSASGDFRDAAPVVWLSTDGQRWQRSAGWQLHPPTGEALSLTGVAGAEGVTVVTGSRGKNTYDIVWASTNGGRTWEEVGVPHPAGAGALTVATTGTSLLAVREIRDGGGAHGQVLASKNGREWTPAADLRVPGYERVLRLSGTSQGVTAAVLADRKIQLSRSVDGGSWQTAGTVPLSEGGEIRDAVMATDTTILVGSQNAGGEAGAALAVRDASGREVPADLTRVPGAVQPDKIVDAMVTANGRVMAVGGANGDGAIWTSTNGQAWQRAQGASAALAGPGRQRLLGVTGGGAGWLAVGYDRTGSQRPLVAASADGAAWHRLDGDAAFQSTGANPMVTYGVAAGRQGYVIVGDDGFGAGTWFSTDLRSWARGIPGGTDNLAGTTAARRFMRDVAATKSGFVSVGGVTDPKIASGVPARRPTIWTSPDGRKWSLQRLPLPAGIQEGWLSHVAARGDLVVAVGTFAAFNGTKAFEYVSRDGGRTWQQVPLPTGSSEESSVTAVTATSKGFVVAGGIGRPRDAVLWTGRDGKDWKAERLRGPVMSGPGDQALTGLTTLGDDLLGVGSTTTGQGDELTLWSGPIP